MDDTNAEFTQSPEPQPRSTSSVHSYAIPAAILIGFAMIAGAVYFGGGSSATVAINGAANEPETVTPEAAPISDITADDHVRGNPNAPIVVVEYSDYDCPFCKQFHETMKAVVDDYGTNGTVAWVYRHFPIASLHPSAPYIAAASECVAELGGNEAFWTFSDLVFSEREINQLTNTARLPEFAAAAGVDQAAFTECAESERLMAEVEADLSEGMKAGVTGTPFSFILVAGQQLPINGAQSYEDMVANIEGLIEQLERAETGGAS